MKYLFAFLCVFSIISCSESFETIDTEQINKDINSSTEIKTPEQLILFYYNYPKNEEKPELKITKRKIDNQVYEITLIHDHQADDSQIAEKIIMTAEKIDDKWNVEKILRNWKCQDGRGHKDWGTEVCN